MFLLVGWQPRYFATFAALLLSGFMTAMSVTYARGIEADCGCFGLGDPISRTTLARRFGLLRNGHLSCRIRLARPPGAVFRNDLELRDLVHKSVPNARKLPECPKFVRTILLNPNRRTGASMVY